jgi:hypothetical protein
MSKKSGAVDVAVALASLVGSALGTPGVWDAWGHHFAARVNRPQAYRSASDAEDVHRVRCQPTPEVFGRWRNEPAPVTVLDQGASRP